MTCRKCEEHFVVSFPDAVVEKGIPRDISKNPEPPADDRAVPASAEKHEETADMSGVTPEESGRAGSAADEPCRSRPAIGSATGVGLSLHHLLLSFCGLCLTAICFSALNALMNMAPSAASQGFLFNPFIAMISFCIYLFTVTALAARGIRGGNVLFRQSVDSDLCASVFTSASFTADSRSLT
jgi:hypothetical protein